MHPPVEAAQPVGALRSQAPNRRAENPADMSPFWPVSNAYVRENRVVNSSMHLKVTTIEIVPGKISDYQVAAK